jgi:hypothetical protein
MVSKLDYRCALGRGKVNLVEELKLQVAPPAGNLKIELRTQSPDVESSSASCACRTSNLKIEL